MNALDQFGTDELRRELERRERMRSQPGPGHRGSFHSGQRNQVRNIGYSRTEDPQRASHVEYIQRIADGTQQPTEAPPFEANCAPDYRWWVNPETGKTERRAQ